MSRTAIISVKENVHSLELWLPCAGCDKVTSHDVVSEVDSRDETPDGDIQVWDEYLTVRCGGCRSLSFCHRSFCSEDVTYDDETGTQRLVPTEKMYPSRIAGRARMEGEFAIPHGVYRVYRETHNALCEKLMVLAGIGIRAIVEAVCKEKNAAGRNLEERIDSLVTLGVITRDGAAILHSLRFMGNVAAHEVTAHTESELDTAFDVVEHLLTTVYVLPHAAGRLPRRRVVAGPPEVVAGR